MRLQSIILLTLLGLSTLHLQPPTIAIAWPLAATGFVQDQTTSLSSPPATNSWAQVPLPYQTNATHIFVTQPATAGNKFYRLRQP